MLIDNKDEAFILFCEILKDLSKQEPFYTELLDFINALQGKKLDNFKQLIFKKITFNKLFN